jgi:hypothetical protein
LTFLNCSYCIIQINFGYFPLLKELRCNFASHGGMIYHGLELKLPKLDHLRHLSCVNRIVEIEKFPYLPKLESLCISESDIVDKLNFETDSIGLIRMVPEITKYTGINFAKKLNQGVRFYTNFTNNYPKNTKENFLSAWEVYWNWRR